MKPIKAAITLLLASSAPGVAASGRRGKKMMKGSASASEPTHNTAERKLADATAFDAGGLTSGEDMGRAECMFAISEASAIVQSGLPGGDAEVRCSSQRMASSLVSSAPGCSEEEAKAFAPDPLCISIDGILPISPPVAENDSGSIILNGDLATDIDVLANDTPGDGGEGLTLNITEITKDPDHGTCTINTDHFGNQVIQYVYDDSGFTGTDTCKYEVCYDERPDLCDVAKVDIHIAAPDCDLSVFIECESGCDPELQDDCITSDMKNNVANITLQFLGGDCSNSDNQQEASGKGKCEPQDPQGNDDNSMIDDSGLVVVPDEAYIVVSDKNGDLFEGCVSKGDTFEVGDGFGSFESNTDVTIYKTEQKEEVLQVVTIHTSGSSPLCLGDRWGAVKLVGAFVGDAEKSIFDTYSLKVTLSTTGDDKITIKKNDLTLESTEPIDFAFTNDSGPLIILDKDTPKEVVVPNVPRDLSIEQLYKYLATAFGGTEKGGECSALNFFELTYSVPDPEPPSPPTCGSGLGCRVDGLPGC